MEAKHTIIPAIVTKAGKGDADSQALLYRQYSKAMFNICIRMTGNQTDAEDLLHDAFVQAFKHLPQLKQPEAFGGWLRRIVVSACIRHSKLPFHTEGWADDYDDNWPGQDSNHWLDGISIELVHHEIKNLPDGCRQVFVLYALEDYTHKDIAGNLGISESTSKSQYHRARQLLKERIIKKMELTDG